MNDNTKFIASLAHDLKNAIGNNMMYSELLSSDLKALAQSDNLMKNELENLFLISENIRISNSKLINQINSWVFAHHFIEGKYKEELSTFNLVELVDRVVQSNLFFIRKKSMKFETECRTNEIIITTDNEILSLILDNILIQSVIFSNSGDIIKITIRDDGENITLEIADSCSRSRKTAIKRFLGEVKITGNEIPDEGILKATGYGMIFCGLAVKALGAEAGVEENDRGGMTFSIKFNRLKI